MTKAELTQTTERARIAMFAIGAVCALRLIHLALMPIQVGLLERLQSGEVVLQAEISANNERLRSVEELHSVGWLVAGVLFLRWLHSAHAQAHDFGRKGRSLPTPRGAVASFFIPFVNFVRPFTQTRALLWASDPSDLELPPEVRERAAPTYRQPARETVLAWWKRPRTFVGAWWVGYLFVDWTPGFSGFSGAGHSHGEIAALLLKSRLAMANNVVAVVVGALCIGVVRGITLCQVERFRRLRLLASQRGEDAPASETTAGQTG
jgi:hypothetical protein